MEGANKIISNTALLYLKMAISIVIALYSTRLILEDLGAADYGIYIVIGGVISMLGFLNATMASSTQRHLSFSMGKNDVDEVRKVFANSILMHFAVGIVLVAVFEVIGLYFLSEKLQIDPNKLETAKTLYHFVVLSTFVTIIAVPYDGIVNAKENMLFLSITGILDSLLKLAIALVLFLPFDDKLLIFGVLMFVKTVFMRLVKQFYCLKKYRKECKVSVLKSYDKEIIKELYSFAGWNFVGVLSYVLRGQGVSIVLNLFFGSVINAAYGVANQVNSQLRLFSEAMLQAIQPQMVKNEGGGDRARVLKLSIASSKFSFIIFSLLALPVFLELEFIINLWLIEVPDSTIVFCRLMILLTFIQQFRSGITVASHAIGKIKEYQLFNAPVQLLSLPLGYMFLFLGYSAYFILIAVLIIESIAVFLNILFFKKLTRFSPWQYVKDVIIINSISFLISFALIYLFNFSLKTLLPEYMRILIIFPVSILFYAMVIYFLSLKKEERQKVNEIFQFVKEKFKK